MIVIGLKHTSELTVTGAVTAITVDSGNMLCKQSDQGRAEGKKIEFKVAAYSGDTALGKGTHLIFIVD